MITKNLTWAVACSHFLRVSGLVVLFALLLAACGGPAAPVQPTEVRPSSPAQPAQPTQVSAVSPTQPAGAANAVMLEIGTSRLSTEFKYDKETLEAPAGSKITLKFNNNTKLDDEVGHNWVLVKPGQEDSVLANGIAAGDDKDWLDVKDPGIIVHTRLIEGDDSDTITFDAPAPGAYTFLCTFPEHHAGGQQGTLTIK